MKKILVLGDSISIEYLEPLKAGLGEDYSVYCKQGLEQAAKDLNYPVGANCGDSRMLLSYLRDENKSKRLNYDIIIFNCGLHDIKYNWMSEKIQIEADEYEQNLRRICALLKSTGAALYFVNSTPVYNDVHNSTENIIKNIDIIRRSADLEKYNSIAQKVMQDNQIPVIDLYSLSLSFGKKALRDHVHYAPEFAARQGQYIAECILNGEK